MFVWCEQIKKKQKQKQNNIMDYEYKIMQNNRMQNRCCGGRAWCVQVNIIAFKIWGVGWLWHRFFYLFAGYLWYHLCCNDMAFDFICGIRCDGSDYNAQPVPNIQYHQHDHFQCIGIYGICIAHANDVFWSGE